MHCAQYNQIQVEQDIISCLWCILSIFYYYWSLTALKNLSGAGRCYTAVGIVCSLQNVHELSKG